MLKITILTDNLVRKRGLLAEHGLSLWIEHDGEIIPLHCTGQSVIWSLKKALGDRVLILCTGETVEVPSKSV